MLTYASHFKWKRKGRKALIVLVCAVSSSEREVSLSHYSWGFVQRMLGKLAKVTTLTTFPLLEYQDLPLYVFKKIILMDRKIFRHHTCLVLDLLECLVLKTWGMGSFYFNLMNHYVWGLSMGCVGVGKEEIAIGINVWCINC